MPDPAPRPRAEPLLRLDVAGRRVDTTTVDVSGGGVLLRGPLDVAVDDVIGLSLRIPGSRTVVEATARVVRLADDGDVGVEFVMLSPQDRTRLTLAVFDERRRNRPGAIP